MELFIKVFFWANIVVTILAMVIISTADYPRTTTKTLGGDIVNLIIYGLTITWAGCLLY